jgi:hypothetical protein
MKRLLFLTTIFCTLSVLGFSQAENLNKGLRINQNPIVRASKADANTNTLLLLNNEQTKGVETYEKDAIYANRKPQDELVEQRDNSSILENTPQPKSGIRSTTIYSQNFETVNSGSMTMTNSQQDGWLIEGTTEAVGAYYHYFGIHSGGHAISGRSLGLSFYQNNGASFFDSFGYQFGNCSYLTNFDLQAYRSISTAGYENIEVSFDWKCAGENYLGSWVDYGQIGYSLNGGSSFTWINTGGSGSGLYHSQTSTQSATVSFPAIVDDNSNFVLAFRAKADECGGNQPAFIIDNIVVNGDALAGPPSCASPISPLAGASGTAHSGNLEWEAVGGADTYDVYFGTSATPPQVATDQVATTYPLDCLLPETTYYWKVVPKNGDGSATGCATWSFTTDNKLHIYRNDWETASEGYFGTSGGTVDGWNTNNATPIGAYNNRWAIGSGTYAINGKSAGLTALLNGSLFGSYFDNWWDMGELHRMIYRPFDMTEYRDIELNFDWKCGGESGQDYGEILTSINGGTNWLTDDQGGLYNDGRYWNSSSIIRSQTLTLPETRNNQSDFVLGFNFDDLSGNGSGSAPSFVVDNIVIRACPYEGYLSSPNQTEPFAWAPPTANTATTISVNETHDCAYFEWEQSTDNGNTWTVIPGETNVSYTTPSDITSNTYYRCRVYFGTGCPGAYQSEAFKIVFEPECTTAISPLNGATNQSTDVTISWDADPLATDYDIYFGEDNPPATLLDNTASTSYDLTNLDYGTTYYWQILPSNAGGTASGCDVWSFTTGAAPPQFHNYGGSEQLTFNNAAYKADAPNFRISHNTSTMDEVQIQISEDVTFPGSTVFDGTFTGSFSGENNFETSLAGDVLDNTEFPQPFDTDVLTHGTLEPGSNTWFAPEYRLPIAYTATGGNPGGRVGYEGNWNHNPDPWAAGWSNFLRLPEVDASGMDEITLSFDVWHSYFDTHPNDKLYLSVYADGGYINLPQTVEIDGTTVTASANTGGGSYAFYFTEERTASNIEVTLDISGITDKSSILLYINARCDYYNSNLFYVYFDNISVTGADQEFTPGTTYYARARGKIGGSWTDWTSDTYSFTYKDQASIEWHQTAEPQLQTNTLSDVITQSGPDYATIPASGGTPSNPFTDPSFETGTGWSTSQSYSVYETYLTSNDNGTNGITDGSQCAKFAEDDYSWQSFVNGEYNNASQQVDLTGVTDIVFDVTHWRNTQSNMYSCGVGRACKVVWSFKVIIGDAGTSGDNSGTEVYSWTPTTPEFGTTNNNDVSVDISSYGFTGVKTVKFSRVVTNGGGVWYDDDKYYLDNIRGEYNATQTGTITSTPINLSSFYGDDSWNELSWDQTLNGGTISMSIEEDISGTWTPVAALTDVSQTGDGVKTIDISSLGSTSRIRLITEFTESGAKGTEPELNNWTITSKKDSPLPVTLLYFNVQCNGHSKEFSWATASETNSDYFLIMESQDNVNFKPIAKIQAAGQSYQTEAYRYVMEGLSDDAYYRLKQVDYDGSSENFSMIYNSCEQDNSHEISVYPNPFNGSEINVMSSDHIGESQIKIYDTSGRLIREMQYDLMEGNNTIRFGNQLAPGAYLIEIANKKTGYQKIPVIVN